MKYELIHKIWNNLSSLIVRGIHIEPKSLLRFYLIWKLFKIYFLLHERKR